MDLKDIEKIVKLMDQYGLSQFKLEHDDTKLELKKGGDVDVDAIQRFMASASTPMMMSHAPAPLPAAPAAAPLAPGGRPPGVKEVTSPMVGTFFRAPKPDMPEFVKVGSKVEATTTVCVIEAMKVFNEIQSELKGEIIEVLVENGSPVQYGQALFLVKTA